MSLRGCARATAVRRLAVARGLWTTVTFAGRTALVFGVYERTRSTFWVSVVLVATVGVSGLMAPLGGWLGDRCCRRRVMIWSELVVAALFVALSVAVDVRLVIALALALAVAQVPFVPAASAVVPNVVGDEQLCWANGLMASAMNSGIVVGPAVAGLLLNAGGAALVYQSNAIMLLMSIAAVCSTAGTIGEAPRLSRELPGGVGFGAIARDAQLTVIVGAGVLTFVAFGVVIVADPALAARFDAGSVAYAMLTTVYGAGAVFGGLLASRMLRASSERGALVGGTIVLAGSIASIAALPSFPAIVLVGGIGGVGHGISVTAWYGLVQRATADVMRARVLGASQAAEQSAAALAMVLGALLVDELGAQLVYVVPGAILALAAGPAAVATRCSPAVYELVRASSSESA